MLRPKIGLDWDDVTAPFNSLAIQMANEKYHIEPPLVLEDIDSWENKGRAGVIKEFYRTEELYLRQRVPERTKKAVRKLMDIADVYFITAVYPEFMGIRAKQIMEEFPELPPENIILGSAKNLVHFDIILDDAVHNVLETPAIYPVMMRKPWNWKMTGLLSVNNMTEFVSLVRQIIRASQSRPA
jgi:guanylate kinase